MRDIPSLLLLMKGVDVMAKKKSIISRHTWDRLHAIILLITYLFYITFTVLYFDSSDMLHEYMVFYFTLYPFMFVIYIYNLTKNVRTLHIHSFFKYVFYTLLGLIAFTIIYEMIEALNRVDNQVLRSISSAYVSFLMLLVIFFDLYLIKELKKITQKRNRKSNPKSKFASTSRSRAKKSTSSK